MKEAAPGFILSLLVLLLLVPSDGYSRHCQTPGPSFDVASIVEKVNPTVVNIQIRDAEGGLQFGSGFIVDARGVIVTNHHVILEALRSNRPISVTLPDGRIVNASVRGFDEPTDLALLEVEAKGDPLPAAILGDSDKLRIGEWVIAIGSPFGLDHTVTLGIISAKNRPIPGSPFNDFLQTDAAINPGNSGGPLLNLRGEVVGISTLASRVGEGLGFAIPINTLKDILPQLREKGRVARGRFAIQVADTTAYLRRRLGLTAEEGVLVLSVEVASSAAKTRIRREDVILKVGDVPIASASQFNRLMASFQPGTEVRLTIFRDGREYEVSGVIEAEATKKEPRP